MARRHAAQHDEDLSDIGPTTLPEFIRQFPDDAACATFLLNLRYPDGFVCETCGDTHAYWMHDRPHVVACKRGHQTSVTAGTVMHGTRTPLTTWFYGAYLVATLTPGISALQFQKQLGLTRYETAFQMLHKLRSALVADDREKLHGAAVEVDEMIVGGVQTRPGRGSTNPLVGCAVEVVNWTDDAGEVRTRAGRVRMRVLPDARAETLTAWVSSIVEPGETVHTDGWAGYNDLRAAGYRHVRMVQKKDDPDSYAPMVHLIISNFKRWLLGTHKGAVSAKHLQSYANEFTFRFNRRFWRGPAFVRALGLAVQDRDRPTWERLYSGAWQHRTNPAR